MKMFLAILLFLSLCLPGKTALNGEVRLTQAANARILTEPEKTAGSGAHPEPGGAGRKAGKSQEMVSGWDVMEPELLAVLLLIMLLGMLHTKQPG